MPPQRNDSLDPTEGTMATADSMPQNCKNCTNRPKGTRGRSRAIPYLISTQNRPHASRSPCADTIMLQEKIRSMPFPTFRPSRSAKTTRRWVPNPAPDNRPLPVHSSSVCKRAQAPSCHEMANRRIPIATTSPWRISHSSERIIPERAGSTRRMQFRPACADGPMSSLKKTTRTRTTSPQSIREIRANHRRRIRARTRDPSRDLGAPARPEAISAA
mmetsp:Transcript_12307/g.35688  ORF Transcript_12307/g.35688 Transcript_12307/m.35688 type:complete len:216 (+) Transcript_12307:434-1081(+)